MCADKTDEKPAYNELYHDHQPVVVAPDIKHIVLVADVISIGKIGSYVSKVMPVCILNYLIPPLKSNP